MHIDHKVMLSVSISIVRNVNFVNCQYFYSTVHKFSINCNKLTITCTYNGFFTNIMEPLSQKYKKVLNSNTNM